MLLRAKDERGPDDDLRLQFEAASRLDPEKNVIRSVIEGMVLRNTVKGGRAPPRRRRSGAPSRRPQIPRQHAHRFIDRMPEAQLTGLVQFLETVEPGASALRNALLDEEEETEAEKAAVAEARQWLRNNAGKGIPPAEPMRRLGLD